MADRCKAKPIAERDSQKAIALREKYRADGERAKADRERDRADENARVLRYLRYSHCLTHLSRVFDRYSMTSPIRDIHAGLHQRFLFLPDRIPSRFSGQSHSTMLRGHNGSQLVL